MLTFNQCYEKLSPAYREALYHSLELFADYERNFKRLARRAQPPKPERQKKSPEYEERRSKFRASLVRDLWEPELRSELVDRIVDACAARLFDVPTLKSAVRLAKERKYEYERTNGSRGKDCVWKSMAAWLKGVYEAKGIEWTPTSSALEPRPVRPKTEIDVDEPKGRLNPADLKPLVDYAREQQHRQPN